MCDSLRYERKKNYNNNNNNIQREIVYTIFPSSLSFCGSVVIKIGLINGETKMQNQKALNVIRMYKKRGNNRNHALRGCACIHTTHTEKKDT